MQVMVPILAKYPDARLRLRGAQRAQSALPYFIMLCTVSNSASEVLSSPSLEFAHLSLGWSWQGPASRPSMKRWDHRR